MNDLVSVIMPVFNDENNLSSAISSVLKQKYEHWELLVINDCSTDRSQQIIAAFVDKDKRISVYHTEKPSGSPTKPRNIGLEHAKGRYVAFLDSDDLWMPCKLEQQIKLFEEHQDAIVVYANYQIMNERSMLYQHTVKAPSETDYHSLLKGNVIGCLTAMYDRQKTGDFRFPSCGHEDYALLLSVLRDGGKAYNTNTVMGIYRLKQVSVSSNKWRAMRWQWHIYTRVEQLGWFSSCYYFVHYAWHAVVKRLWFLTSAKASLE